MEGSEFAPRFDQERLKRMTILAHAMKKRFKQNHDPTHITGVSQAHSSNNRATPTDYLKQPLLSSQSAGTIYADSSSLNRAELKRNESV